MPLQALKKKLPPARPVCIVMIVSHRQRLCETSPQVLMTKTWSTGVCGRRGEEQVCRATHLLAGACAGASFPSVSGMPTAAAAHMERSPNTLGTALPAASAALAHAHPGGDPLAWHPGHSTSARNKWTVKHSQQGGPVASFHTPPKSQREHVYVTDTRMMIYLCPVLQTSFRKVVLFHENCPCNAIQAIWITYADPNSEENKKFITVRNMKGKQIV